MFSHVIVGVNDLEASRKFYDALLSINLSYRITLELLIQDQHIIPVNVGDHDAAY
jgi:catechol 2,3-dioxygenase-like lactoylglutathione lyase family enzyme